MTSRWQLPPPRRSKKRLRVQTKASSSCPPQRKSFFLATPEKKKKKKKSQSWYRGRGGRQWRPTEFSGFAMRRQSPDWGNHSGYRTWRRPLRERTRDVADHPERERARARWMSMVAVLLFLELNGGCGGHDKRLPHWWSPAGPVPLPAPARSRLQNTTTHNVFNSPSRKMQHFSDCCSQKFFIVWQLFFVFSLNVMKQAGILHSLKQ